jgi:hypothetical protein
MIPHLRMTFWPSSILNNAELIFAHFELKGLSLKGEALGFSVDFDHPN